MNIMMAGIFVIYEKGYQDDILAKKGMESFGIYFFLKNLLWLNLSYFFFC